MEKRKAYEVMKSSVLKNFAPTKEEIQSLNSFFLIRFISNDPNSIYIANALNCNSSIPIEAQYNFVRNSTLNKVAFITYPKKEKILSDKELQIIMRHFKTNKSVSLEYIKVLGEAKTQEILELYSKIKFEN